MSTRVRVPVLTYHSINISGNAYVSNDHVALADDLEVLEALGFRVISLPKLVNALRLGRIEELATKFVALSFDDGQNFDYYDLMHPSHGKQRSFLNILRDFQERSRFGTESNLHATSFVIVSPAARRKLDVTCMVGEDWWTDEWWQPAIASGLMSIANHSWDHNHSTLDVVASPRATKGTFSTVVTFADAEAQIAQAGTYLRKIAANDGTTLFAYPYGESNDYLIDEYFPREGERIGLKGAFDCRPEPLTADSNVWRLPRFVCGRDWKSRTDLTALLRGAT